MDQRAIDFVRDYLAEARRVLDEASGSPEFAQAVAAIAERIADAMRAGGKVLLAGNGGSAADAQHIAGELLSRFYFDRAPLFAIALTTDTSVLTAISNDYGYDQVFERQVRGLGRAGDVFIGISTSGRSANIVRALAAAHALGVTTVGFTGRSAGDMAQHCDLLLEAPSDVTPHIQQIHIVTAHAICALIERALFPAPGS